MNGVHAWPAMFLVWILMASCSGYARPPVATEPPAAQGPSPSVAQPLHCTLPVIHFTIQVGAFSIPERAALEAARLQQTGLDAYFFLDEDELYKVRLERFDTLDTARERALELQSGGLIEAFMIARPGRETDVRDPVSFLRENILQTARRFVGMPYRWGGACERGGFDCSGLTMTVYRLNGLDLPRSAAGQYRAGKPVAKDALEPGDLVFFATGRGNDVTHVGIYSSQGRFIHAPGRGKTIQTAPLSGDYFKKRYVGARRYF